MMRSLYSGVSGLTSHQTKMDVIGNNIANVNTYGFKSSSVAFADLMYQTTGSATAGTANEGGVDPSQIGYGTQVASINKNMSRSSFQSSASTLDLAIAGEGFIQVQDKAGNSFYTRAGNLKVDKSGNLVDSNGKFVLGTVNADPTNAAGLSTAAGSTKIAIKIPPVYKASYTPATALVVTGVTDPNYTLAFNNGNQINDIAVTVKTAAAATDPSKVEYDVTTPTAPKLTITLSAADKAEIKTVEQLQTKINTMINAEMKKDGGVMNSDNFKGGKISITLDTSKNTTALTAAQNEAVQTAAITAITGGTAATLVAKKTEQSYSNLTSFTVSENGTMIGVHPVLGLLTLGRIDLATFDNPSGLEESGNSYYSATTASGDANVAIPGFDGAGGLVSSALEMSNVNLAQEFSDMITAQRGFQANSRIITTSDSMLEELVNLKR